MKSGRIVFQAGEAVVFPTACSGGELCWCHVVQAAMWPSFVVIAPPSGGDPPGFEQVLEADDAWHSSRRLLLKLST